MRLVGGAMWKSLSVAVFAGLALAACQALQPSSTLPPRDAEPGVVVANYLQALVDGDCAKARALTTNDGLAVQKPLCDRPRVTAFSELSRDGARPSPTEVIYAVQLTIRGSEDGLFDGDNTMFVQVLLQPGGVWRVTGVGSGP